MDNGKLIKFYAQCLDKGYVDMSDSTQSLKAKVIASDLGLDYKNITKVFSEAKTLYENQKAREERLAVNGEEILTIDNYSIFRRPDGSIYTEYQGKRIEDVSFSVKKGAVLSYTYHPSQTIFTGASSGGIIMGGTHQTKAYYDERVDSTGKGEVVAIFNNEQHSIKTATIPKTISKLFKRDPLFKRLAKQNPGGSHYIICKHKSTVDASIAGQLLAQKHSFEEQMATLSNINDMDRISYEECVDIANLLNRIIKNDHPLSDDQLYDEAELLSKSSSIGELERAHSIFTNISDYLDARTKASEIKEKIEELRQEEKERKILEEEENRAKFKKRLPFIIATIVIIIIAIIIAIPYLSKTSQYNDAKDLLSNGKYDEALTAFESLGSFSNAEEMTQECIYQKALGLTSTQDYDEAMALFVQIETYRDSNNQINQCKQGLYDLGISLFQNKKYEDALKTFTTIEGFLDTEEWINKTNEAIEKEIKAAKEEQEKEERIISIKETYNEYLQAGDPVTAYQCLSSFSDSFVEKSNMLSYLEKYVKFAGEWEFVSGDAKLLSGRNYDKDIIAITTRVICIQVDEGNNLQDNGYQFQFFVSSNEYEDGTGWVYSHDGSLSYSVANASGSGFYKQEKRSGEYSADFVVKIGGNGNLIFERYNNDSPYELLSQAEYKRK